MIFLSQMYKNREIFWGGQKLQHILGCQNYGLKSHFRVPFFTLHILYIRFLIFAKNILEYDFSLQNDIAEKSEKHARGTVLLCFVDNEYTYHEFYFAKFVICQQTLPPFFFKQMFSSQKPWLN